MEAFSSTETRDFRNDILNYVEQQNTYNNFRSYFQQLIINLMKNGNMNKKLVGRNLEASTNLESVNKLIAEYFQSQENHLSLSVFLAEAPLVDPFSKDINTDLRFTQEAVLNILEDLGVTKGSDTADEILKYYEDNNSTSLLYCILYHIIARNSRQKVEFRFAHIKNELMNLANSVQKYSNQVQMYTEQLIQKQSDLAMREKVLSEKEARTPEQVLEDEDDNSRTADKSTMSVECAQQSQQTDDASHLLIKILNNHIHQLEKFANSLTRKQANYIFRVYQYERINEQLKTDIDFAHIRLQRPNTK